MIKLTPSMRLKVKRDTFFLSEPNHGVYFRNNVSSFRMEGSTINQWVEKLIPMFNGEYTLGNLTDGLPDPYRDRVYEIAEVLVQNGFAQDVSQDHPHQLVDEILKKYASQIEFLDSFGDSGAYRFQTYRQTKVLAIGSGPMLVSLASALLESGLPNFHVFITNTVPTNRSRFRELVEHAQTTDPEIMVEEVTIKKEEEMSWQEMVQEYDAILYVSQEGDIKELRSLNTICREEKKMFLPAVCIDQVGIAGPLVHPNAKGCWESAWRRIHRSVFTTDNQFSDYSSTAGAMLANVIVFELFKELTSVNESKEKNQFFLLDLNSLEGNWHSFLPHPLVDGHKRAERIESLRPERSLDTDDPSKLLLYFSQLTSAESGIFHYWEEGDLKQLPLAQCRVLVVDPMSKGPAELLPEMISTGLTHEEARRNAGLMGIETYVAQLARQFVMDLPLDQEIDAGMVNLGEFIGVGAGETVAEGVGRGLQRCLHEELSKQQLGQNIVVNRIRLDRVEDERCRFYLQALTTLQGAPLIGLGEELCGFPVVWIGVNNQWYRSVNLNLTMALRSGLQQALLEAQNRATFHATQSLRGSNVILKGKLPRILDIPACEVATNMDILQSALELLERNRKKMIVFDMALEPFLQEKLAGVYGVVLLREEESL